MPKTVILSCPTLRGELTAALAEASSEAVAYFLPRRLHSDPKELHAYTQDMIDHFYNADRIVLCVSGCGGGTVGLRASSAELVVPRTRDCLDILLSGDSLASLERDISGVYFTESWMEFSKASDIDLDKLTAKMGREAAEDFLRRLYKTFNKFYIIDTGCYDLQAVKDYIAPLVEILSGTITFLHGPCGILHKIAREAFDGDFAVIPKGGEVPKGIFLKNK
ncbi:MAG: DUF1638 domain-containing protein [Schwartzia sp.]|nr:DUF1638 domain-containing protein [Schwartzia sp. (in: firmicutes)]